MVDYSLPIWLFLENSGTLVFYFAAHTYKWIDYKENDAGKCEFHVPGEKTVKDLVAVVAVAGLSSGLKIVPQMTYGH